MVAITTVDAACQTEAVEDEAQSGKAVEAQDVAHQTDAETAIHRRGLLNGYIRLDTGLQRK